MSTIIFGHGYTGSRLSRVLPESLSTELPELCKGDNIPFDFNDERTWLNLPEFDRAVITFKMCDEVRAQKFARLLRNKKIVLLSSAKNIANVAPDQLISEQNPLADIARVKAEAPFELSAIILYLGLILGEKRTPKKWLSEKRIKNGNKFVNMIHVDDLCRIIKYFLTKELPPDKYLVSDGAAKKWHEIARPLGYELHSYETGLESRVFDTKKLRSILPENFRFTQSYH